jgi:hypothetical protein
MRDYTLEGEAGNSVIQRSQRAKNEGFLVSGVNEESSIVL